MKDHAKLSASSSHRWILCPGSIKAEEGLPDVKNKYAEEGIQAHDVSARILNQEDISDLKISSEMKENIQKYIDYVNELKEQDLDNVLTIEKTISFSHVVPEGFGTADAIIESYSHLHIIDFKYGNGSKIYAYKNSQMLLYAMAALNESVNSHSIESIILHIVQPRMNHYDTWHISAKELMFYEGYIKAKAEDALREDALRIPSSKACKWCKANTSCMALYKFTDVMEDQTDESLNDLDIKNILDKSELIKNFLNNIENKVFERLSLGEEFRGYKLVKGRSIRKIKPESHNKLFELLGDKAYIKSPIGVTALEKLVDTETLNDLVYLSTAKPVLVNEGDKRKPFIPKELDFDPVEGGLL